MSSKIQNCDTENDSDPEEFSPLTLSTDLTRPLQNDDPSLKLFDKSVETLNVVDVYNIAASVGQEFERLTDAFGGAVFCGVMPKIIRVLEMLEALVTNKEKETVEITELSTTLKKLQLESKAKDEKQQEEISIVESAWKDETRSLLESVKTLEEDNQKLTALLTEKLQEESSGEVPVSEQQTSLITNLQKQITQQRDEIRMKNANLEERTQEIDALQSQIQRLTKLNGDIRNKVYILERQGKNLIEEKASLEAKLHSNGPNMAELQLRSLQKDKISESQVDTEPPQTDESTSTTTLDPLVANKLIIDLNDPNRPRYTLQELQEVLTDRNQLKARCFLLEEELIFYRGDDWVEVGENEIRQSKINAVRQPPPQAPESGIRRFFHYLTGDGAWRSRNPAPLPHPPDARENEDDGKDLVDPKVMRELVPDAKQIRDLTAAIDVSTKFTQSEMKEMSPVHERDDFSP